MAVGKLVNIATGVGGISTAFRRFNAVLKANPIIFIASAIAAASVAAYNFLKPLLDIEATFKEKIAYAVDAFLIKIKKTYAAVADATGALGSGIAEIFTKAFVDWDVEGAVATFNGLGDRIKNAFLAGYGEDFEPVFLDPDRFDEIDGKIAQIRASQSDFNNELDITEDAVNAVTDGIVEIPESIDEANKKAEALRKKLRDAFTEALRGAIEFENIALGQIDLDKLEESYDLAKQSQDNYLNNGLINQDKYNQNLLDLDKEYYRQRDLLEEQSLRKRIQNLLTEFEKLQNFKINAADLERLQRIGNEERNKAIIDKRIEFEKKSEAEKYQFAAQQASSFFSDLAQVNKKFARAAKIAAIAEATINTYVGATKALASYPPPFNFIAAAAVVASGFAQVAAIRAQPMQRGGALGVGQPTLVGEDGPELIVPKQPGTVIPREVAQAIEGANGNQGPVTVNFNIETVDAEGFDELLISRRGTITGIINQAMQQRGRQGVV